MNRWIVLMALVGAGACGSAEESTPTQPQAEALPSPPVPTPPAPEPPPPEPSAPEPQGPSRGPASTQAQAILAELAGSTAPLTGDCTDFAEGLPTATLGPLIESLRRDASAEDARCEPAADGGRSCRLELVNDVDAELEFFAEILLTLDPSGDVVTMRCNFAG